MDKMTDVSIMQASYYMLCKECIETSCFVPVESYHLSVVFVLLDKFNFLRVVME
jgi:hypothetical protein